MVKSAIRLFKQGALNRRRDAIVAHHGMLWRLAMAWSHDRDLADDLVQETLVRALEKAGDLRDERQLKPWLCAILHNCWRNHWRQRRPVAEVNIGSDLRFSVDDDSAREAEHACVRRAIAALPQGQREVVTLVELEGFSYKEVSSALNIPVGTVMSRLCRARRALVERLECGDQAASKEQSGHRLRAVK